MKKIYYSLFILLVFTKTNAQTTVSIPASADNTIYEDYQDNSNALGENIFAGNNASFFKRRGLIRFNIGAAIPAGSVITAVTLTLNCNKTRAGADNVSLYRLNALWGEGSSNAGSVNDGAGASATLIDATWVCTFANGTGGCNASWTTPGGVYNATVSATTSVGGALANYTWSSAQMVNDVQAWLNDSAVNNGWIIIGDETLTQTTKRFGSRENSTVANRPQLSVTYNTPLPCTTNTWTGAVSSAWETSGNWSCGVVPNATMDVIINSGTVTLNSNRSCRSINIHPGVSFTVSNGFILTVVH